MKFPFRIFSVSMAAVLLFQSPMIYAANSISNPDAFVDLALSGDSGTLKSTGALNGIGGLKGRKVEGASDKKARVYDVTGNARIAKKDLKEWTAIKPGIVIEEGDIILTDKNSNVSLTFDKEYLNASYIPANTRAIFRSIEPTDIQLEDGTIYNIFDNLPKREEWKVSTPTAVAAVRGTWWLVNFHAATGELIAATLQIADDGDDSVVKVTDILENGAEGANLNVPEDFEIYLDKNQEPDASMIRDLNPDWIPQIWDFLEKLAALRAARSSLLPPTGGEGPIEPLNPVENGLAGPVHPVLDPELDIKNVPPLPEPPPSPSDSSDESSEGGSEPVPPQAESTEPLFEEQQLSFVDRSQE